MGTMFGLFVCGRSVIIGLEKNRSYQWFRGNRQAVFTGLFEVNLFILSQ